MVIVHAVGPFGAEEIQPPRDLVHELGERGLVGVQTDVPPTSEEAALEEIPRLIAEHRPSAWIGVGFAGNRVSLSLEAVAVNLRVWAADDTQPEGPGEDTQARLTDGPDAYMTTLPADDVLDAWQEHGVPGYLSLIAGSYSGNRSFYAAAHAVAESGLDCKVGFLNLPRVPEMLTEPKAQASVARELQLQGLIDLATAAQVHADSVGPYLRSAL